MPAQKRILVLTPYRVGVVPGPRSSIELWEKVLAPAGISFDYSPFETEALQAVIYQRGHVAEKATRLLAAYVRRLGGMRAVNDYDAVLVYREAALIGPALLERWVARRKPIIYQLDDPLYVPYRSPSNGWFSYLKFFGKVRTICRLSRLVVVNSSYHAEYARRFATNVVQIPSVVDAEIYRPRTPTGDSGGICVGWSGSTTTVSNLQLIRAPLAALSERDDVRLRFIGATQFDMPEVQHEALPWRADTEVDDLSALDVGLLPVPDNPWNRRKFYLKLVQYMALGIPPVASPLGGNPAVIEDGKTGLFARSETDWRLTLDRLLDDHELRETIGQQAAIEAHRHYTLQANADKIVETFQRALG